MGDVSRSRQVNRLEETEAQLKAAGVEGSTYVKDLGGDSMMMQEVLRDQNRIDQTKETDKGSAKAFRLTPAGAPTPGNES